MSARNVDDNGRGLRCMLSRWLILRTLENAGQPGEWLSGHLGHCASCSAYWRKARRLEAALRMPAPAEAGARVSAVEFEGGRRLAQRVGGVAALAACLAVLVMVLSDPFADRSIEPSYYSDADAAIAGPVEAGDAGEIDFALDDLAWPLHAGRATGGAAAMYVANLAEQSIDEEVSRLAADTQWIGRSLLSHVPIDFAGMVEAID